MNALKSRIKRLLGPGLTRVVYEAIHTLHVYPQYIFGRGRAGRLRSIDIEMTFACNSFCRMCPLHGEHRDGRKPPMGRTGMMSGDDLRELIRQCAGMGVEYIGFTGGEPLLHPDTIELVAYAHSLGMKTGMNSNGLLLNEDRLTRLIEGGLDVLSVSIDGPEPVHDHIRRVPGMFSRIIRNLGILRAVQDRTGRANPAVSIACTVSALNQDCIDEMIEIAAAQGLPLSTSPIFWASQEQIDATNRLIPIDPGIKPEDWIIPDHIRKVDAPRMAQRMKTAIRSARRAPVPVKIEPEISSEKDIRAWFYDPADASNNKCFYAHETTRVNPDGVVYPCSAMVNLGNVREQPLEEIWNGPRYVSFRNTLRRSGLLPICTKCCVLSRYNIVGRFLPRLAWFRRESEPAPPAE